MPETTILVIDDDHSVHAAIESRLTSIVDRIWSAKRPSEGIRIAAQHKPDVILLDVNMPEMDGYKVCRHLKENAGTRDTPILFLTVDGNVEHIAKALDCGGSDYIIKPFNEVELEARVRAAARTKKMFDLLREQARIDGLTGLSNRAAMDDALLAASSSHERTGQPVALVLLDLDQFKQINDTWGHGVGDAVLREIGAALRSQCRPYDVACRYGGDEFAVILSQTAGADAQRIADRILASISQIGVPAAGTTVGVGSSAGLVTSNELPGDFGPAEILKAADEALYRAKNEGGHRIVVASER